MSRFYHLDKVSETKEKPVIRFEGWQDIPKGIAALMTLINNK